MLADALAGAVLESLPVGVLVLGITPGRPPRVVVTAANPAAGRVLDRGAATLVGRPLTALFPGLAEQGAEALLAHAAAVGACVDLQEVALAGAAGGTRLTLRAVPVDADTVAVVLDDETTRLATEARLARQAVRDPLTGLPNRALLVDRLDQALVAARPSRPVALLVADVEQFQQVNETLGHHHGDQLLREVAVRLAGTIDESATVARVGGDEFGIVLPGSGRQEAEAVAGAVVGALQSPVVLDGLALPVRVSIGIALAPDHGDDADSLLRRADVALAVAKRSEAAQAVYQPDHERHSRRRLALAADLRRALDEGELELHHQPMLAVRSGRVAGVECLVRWRHPEHQLLPPSEFLDLAAVTGLLAPLTRWVLAEAIRQCAAWRRQGLDLSVAVNVSVRDLHDPALPGHVGRLLARHRVPADRLVLELTESEVMEDPAAALAVLVELDRVGVRTSVDDFGTGWSSLAYLRRLPLDQIKIDRSFVAGMAEHAPDEVIVRTIVDLGHNLDLEVVAEGVEQEATLARLVELGCDRVQGFLVSPPLEAAALPRWLAGYRPPASLVLDLTGVRPRTSETAADPPR
ncbi:MAG: EAL domain-containing protein [Acidimicrobiales bacterium]|nr:EAL domain-containing protein [Acidimicrobiales bacterium]